MVEMTVTSHVTLIWLRIVRNCPSRATVMATRVADVLILASVSPVIDKQLARISLINAVLLVRVPVDVRNSQFS